MGQSVTGRAQLQQTHPAFCDCTGIEMMRKIIVVCVIVALGWMNEPVKAASLSEEDVLKHWYHLVLKLVRRTATYSPPLASRNFAYLGITSYEAMASGNIKLVSLAGQLKDLPPIPTRDRGKTYDNAIVLNAALNGALQYYFGNTGPSGQNALRSTAQKLDAMLRKGVPNNVAKRSKKFGEAVAKHIFLWSELDGAAKIKNMGFPLDYELKPGPSHWVPTSQQGLQQVPLLPDWRKNRTFAMPASHSCKIKPHPTYSEDKNSDFFKEAREVYDVRSKLTEEQITIARFWSDDPMLSPTPPGHWVSIFLQISEKDNLPAAAMTEGLARLGIAVADAFIGCWDAKFEYDLLRPVSYIGRVIDAKWEPLLTTPPFPEYPSGHSVQSGAAAIVMNQMFGKTRAFEDATHAGDGIAVRHFKSFDGAADEAALSRLYGGIHFRAAIIRGLEQGRCIGAFASKLVMAKW